MACTERNSINGWVFEKRLGQGGFGAVNLYRNEATGERLAIKQCHRSGDEIQDRIRSRWKQECEIMVRMKHVNVVRGYQLPAELCELAGPDLPALAMEFCEQGDLRKVLNLPSNVCGLPEYQVRQIAYDASAGVEYLHSQHVVHRDLKPENIVIQPTEQGLRYKLIDLGYAKDLSTDSICVSYVGTQQYLAPELRMGPGSYERYTSTVDFWSLGITVYECITGKRPFPDFPDQAKWLDLVKRKLKMHISASITPDQVIKYSEKLESPNHLCRLSQGFFEQWLRYMLLFDAGIRGGVDSSSRVPTEDRPKCFILLDKIKSTKLIFIYSVQTNEVLSFPVRADSGNSSRPLTIENISIMIRSSTAIDDANQEFITSTGIVADIAGELEKYSNETNDKQDRDTIDLYLFSKTSTPGRSEQRKMRPLPENIAVIMSNKEKDTVWADQHMMCKHVIYYCSELIRDFQRLVDAQTAASVCMMREKMKLNQLQSKLKDDCSTLVARMDFFSQSAEVDQAEFLTLKTNGTFSQIAYDKWEARRKEVALLQNLVDEVSEQHGVCEKLNARIQELMSSPCGKNTLHMRMQEHLRVANDINKRLRELTHEQRAKASFTGNLIECVEQCSQEYYHRSNELCAHVSKVIDYKMEIMKLRPPVENLVERVCRANNEVLKQQRNRQKEIWGILARVAEQISVEKLKMQSGAIGEVLPVTADVTRLNLYPTSIADHGEASLDMESLQVVDESIATRKKMEALLSRMTKQEEDYKTMNCTLDWSFLKSGEPN